jgi:diguanylate cyclase (GGDEF)-like protein
MLILVSYFTYPIEASSSVVSKTEAEKISLERKWEFYWEQLLEPEDFKRLPLQPVYIEVPSSWYGKMIKDEPITSFGYATYRLVFTIPEKDIGENKALYLENIGSSYQLWIDGQSQGTVGVVGRSSSEEYPMIRTNLILFEPKQETVEIVLQISNFSFREGGIIGEVSYGDPRAFFRLILKSQFKDIFIIGGFFFIGLYHLIIYGLRKVDVSSLLLGLGGFIGALRTFIVSSHFVYLQFPTFNWEWMTKIEYLVELIGFILLILFMKNLYPEEVHKFTLRISYCFAALYGGYILIAPTHIFTSTLLIQVTIIAMILIYFVFYVGILAALRKREGGLVNLVGLFFIIVAICNDTFYYTNILNTVEIFEYSILLFILLQAVIISYRYSLLFSKNKMLTAELVTMNNTLEEKVNSRTKELHERNKELFQMANVDGLTGVYNRRYFSDQVRKWLNHSSSRIGLLLLDIDNFKRINDTYGHIAGDQVLMEFSRVLKSVIEGDGLVSRVGGEEFAVCLKNISEEECVVLAERLLEIIENHIIILDNEIQLSITASCGIAYTNEKPKKFEVLYHQADQALYTSKESGKNKVTLGASR